MTTVRNPHVGSAVRPMTQGAAVTPSDSVNLPTPSAGLYVGVAGDVKVVWADGTTVVLKNLAAGVVHPIACVRVYSTLTTATNIVALW